MYSYIKTNGKHHGMFPSTATTVTPVIDTTPVSDLTFVAHGAMNEFPTAPVVNVPVSSGSCVSHPSAVGSSDCSAHSLTGSVATSVPTGAKSTSAPPGTYTDTRSLSGPTSGTSATIMAVLSSKACKDLLVLVYVGVTFGPESKKIKDDKKLDEQRGLKFWTRLGDVVSEDLDEGSGGCVDYDYY